MRRLVLVLLLCACGRGAPSAPDAPPAKPDAGPDPRAAIEKAWTSGDSSAAPGLAKDAASPSVDVRVLAVRALGNLGGEAQRGALTVALADKESKVRAAAAVALGVFGRRKVAFDAPTRAALVGLARDPDAEVRFGAAYALAQEPSPPADADVAAALAGLAKDPEAAVRPWAVRGLAARGNLDASVSALDDADAVVRVEAARALGGARSTPALREKLAGWLLTEWTAVGDLEARLLSDRIHPIIEAMALLSGHAAEKPVAAVLAHLAEATKVDQSVVKTRYTPEVLRPVDMVNCLAAAARVRAGAPIAELLGCGEPSGKGWPQFKRRELAARIIGDGAGGTPAVRLATLERLWADPDARVRAAVAAAAAGIDDPRAVKIVVAALGDATVVAGSVADTLAGATSVKPAVVDAALARARKALDASDLELLMSLLAVLETAKAPAAQPFFQAAYLHPNISVREQGRSGLRALTGKDPGPVDRRPAVGPPVPRLQGVSKVVWNVQTGKGNFTVELDPALAPWNVGVLTHLAETGFYDGTLWHRVVPGFVVQGGDPTSSGWGGPGFVVPAEPSSQPYLRGTVGIADAGRDTGGSQWFIALARAPHLEGRYTVVGRVVQGMDVVDRLVIGDAVEKIQVQKVP